MDLSPVINEFVRMFFLYLMPTLAIIAILKSPWFKGVVGEFIVNFYARLMLDKNEYRLIKNVTLPTDDGTTQLDHIIVSVYGVFVVETKNMKGWIFGGENQRTWTQKIYKHSNQFQNPLHQNCKHVKTLQRLLDLEDDQVHSVVVFVGDSKFKTEMPENVTSGGGYARFIKSKKKLVLTPEAVEEIVQQIESGRLSPSWRTHREHVKHVKAIAAEKTNKVACPTRGSRMVLREVKKGPNQGKQFWGCSKFPQCREGDSRRETNG